MSESHADQIDNHIPFADTYANGAARTVATGFPRGPASAIVIFDASDIGKFVRQEDDNSIWMLTAITPTWQQVDRTGLDSTDISDFNEAVEDRIGAMIVDSSSIDASYDDTPGTTSLEVKPGAPPLSPGTVTLTDGATITWATAGARQNNAEVTLGGNRTLDITGEVDGATGLLIVKQDGTGGRSLTLPGNSLVINGGGGAVVLSTGPDDIDILTWYYDDTNFFWTIGKDYS